MHTAVVEVPRLYSKNRPGTRRGEIGVRNELHALHVYSGLKQHRIRSADDPHYVAGLDHVELAGLRFRERREIESMPVDIANIGGHERILHPGYVERHLHFKLALPACGDLVCVHGEDIRDLHARKREGRSGKRRAQD